MDTRKSIFDIERRIDLQKEHISLVRYMKDNQLYYDFSEGCSVTLLSLIDSFVVEWEYRGTAFNINQYLERLGIEDPLSRSKYSDTEVIWCLELYINLIKCATKDINSMGLHPEVISGINYHVKKVFENIHEILEQINMTYSTVGDKTVIHKRDADVDSVIEILPMLADVLLGYLDFRNANDVEYKRNVLLQIASHMEKRRDEYTKLDNALTNSVFFAFNSFGIRHNNDKQIIFKSLEEQISVYDKVFKMALHLIRGLEIRELIMDINSYKN